MNDVDNEYIQEEENKAYLPSNASFSNPDNQDLSSPYNEYFQNNPQTFYSKSREQSSQDEENQDLEYDPEQEYQEENQSEEYYEEAKNYVQNDEEADADQYENILTSMRQKVKQMKNKLKPNEDQYKSVPLSARTSKSQLQGFNMNTMQISGYDNKERQNQR